MFPSCFAVLKRCLRRFLQQAEEQAERILALISPASFVGVLYILLHIKRPTQEDTLPDVECSRQKKRVRLNSPVYHMLDESGGLHVLRLPKQSYSKMGEKTRHGSPGRATLILCECPGSMMGNKSSVISHRGRATPWPYT